MRKSTFSVDEFLTSSHTFTGDYVRTQEKLNSENVILLRDLTDKEGLIHLHHHWFTESTFPMDLEKGDKVKFEASFEKMSRHPKYYSTVVDSKMPELVGLSISLTNIYNISIVKEKKKSILEQYTKLRKK